MKDDNITDYKNYKKICKLTKPRSPIVIEFMTDDLPTEWLINIVKYKAKTGIVTDSVMILNPEVVGRIEGFQRDGYILTEA